ncbi:hypothetical protein HGI30_15840 [Paenibacillus albicereus]|uniref:Uncharacterized protein n=1 Tax=Paenibacillus albicereus TaxID=2726185 RepID=A0A6H2GZR5_9BACL|nr:hypothetical protein [Paenibacillus albicereus]QJC52892.1 hypothetical protein HGI30_15840 [Paenibacillus albicereus]
MYDLIIELAHTVWKNGLSLSALGTAVYVLLKQRKVKQALRRVVPWLLSDDSEVKAYVANQLVIMENQRRTMAALGVDPLWPEDARTSKTSRSFRRALKTFSISFLAARSRARAAAAKELLSVTNSTTSKRRKQTMKKWLRPDSLTVIGAAAAAAATRLLGVEIDLTNLAAATLVLLGYLKANEYVTVVRGANGLPIGFKANSRKLVFTLTAFGLIVADELFKLQLGNELIFTLTAAVTGYNLVEGKKDAKEAEQEGAEARQTY